MPSSYSSPFSSYWPTATTIFLSSYLLFVHRKEFWALEVNHMDGVRFYPDFRFPCNVVDMPFEFPKIGKNTDVNFSCFAEEV
jgi:hypothetical protein